MNFQFQLFLLSSGHQGAGCPEIDFLSNSIYFLQLAEQPNAAGEKLRVFKVSNLCSRTCVEKLSLHFFWLWDQNVVKWRRLSYANKWRTCVSNQRDKLFLYRIKEKKIMNLLVYSDFTITFLKASTQMKTLHLYRSFWQLRMCLRRTKSGRSGRKSAGMPG